MLFIVCSGFFDASIKSFSPSAASNPADKQQQEPVREAESAAAPGDNKAETTEPHPSYGSAAFSAAASAATTATSVGVSAAQTATAAGGWFARRLSSKCSSVPSIHEFLNCFMFSVGIQSIVRRPSAAEESPAAASESVEEQPTAVQSEPETAAATSEPAAEESAPATLAVEQPEATAAPTVESEQVVADLPESSTPTAVTEESTAGGGEDTTAAPAAITRPSVKPRKEKKSDA